MYSVRVYTGVSCSPTVLSSDLISLYTPTYTESPFLCKVVCNGACGLSLQATSEKISGYLQGKWPTVSLFFVTFTAINPSDCQTPVWREVFALLQVSKHLDKHGIPEYSKFIILQNYDSKCFAKTQTPLHV